MNGSNEQVKDELIEKPLRGLSEAFRKLKNDIPLNELELDSLTNMIDEFTTVSLHGNSVGQDVEKIAREVNIHHHTKSCKKYDETCRFKYPRFPCHKTIVAKPLKGTNEEKKILMTKHNENLNKVSFQRVFVLEPFIANYDKK